MALKTEIFGPTLQAYVFPFEGGNEHILTIHNALLSIDTSKTIADPAGTFSITLTSERDSVGRTWAKRIKPMDYIELYLSRTATKGASNDVVGDDPKKAKIVMRCFVDNVGESTRVGNDGRIRRVVTINGRDFGKVLLKRALVFASEVDPLANLAEAGWNYFMGLHLGLDFSGFLTPLDFLSRVRELLLSDPVIGAQFRNGRVPSLHAETDIPDSHLVQIINLTPTTGSLWNFLQSLEGKPFNELFVRDDDDFPRLHWRMAPLKDKAGRIARDGAQTPPVIEVSLTDVVAEDTQISDNEAFCYYLTLPPFGEQQGFQGAFLSAAVPGDPFGASGADPFSGGPVAAGTGGLSNPILRRDIFERYGFQTLSAVYPIPPFLVTVGREVDASQASLQTELARLNAWMHNVFSPNPALEHGTFILRGNPLLRVGNYMRIKEQKREFYIESVRHSFSVWPIPSFTTTVDVTRGRWYENNPYPDLSWL